VPPKRKKQTGPPKLNPEKLVAELIGLLQKFERGLGGKNTRDKVLKLVFAAHIFRRLGKSMVSVELRMNARDRILKYFQKYPRTVISSNELLIISGITEYARRIRELRVESGWRILSGEGAKKMVRAGELDLVINGYTIKKMKAQDYILLDTKRDAEAASRWKTANSIRKLKVGVKKKIIDFLRQNVGAHVTGEELEYLATGATEWARRVRELRTEEGWPITTKQTGRPDLPVGVYVLERDRQLPPHDRTIPDAVRGQVLERDKYKCQNKHCGWTQDKWNKAAPRHLELHHVKEHAKGGKNIPKNLRTLCNVCHDGIHSKSKKVQIKLD